MDKIVWFALICYEVVLAVILVIFSLWLYQQPDYQMMENMPLLQRMSSIIIGFIFLLMIMPCFSIFVDGEV